jgi:hypothetical protein
VSGYIQFSGSSYTEACHDMAAEISYYPFEKRAYISHLGEFFVYGHPQPLYDELKVRIIRKSPLWKTFIKCGEYEVKVTGFDCHGNPINYEYAKEVKFL